MGIKVDTSKFEAALKLAMLHTHSTMADRINTACLDVILKASYLTKKAEKSQIVYDLRKEVSSSSKDPTQLAYLVINARRRKEGKKAIAGTDMAMAVEALIKERIRAIGFIAYAGWDKANRAFGGHGFGAKGYNPKFERSSASYGYGTKAEVGRLRGYMCNTAAGAEKVAAEPLRKALELVAVELVRHVEEKLAKEFSKISK
jgi:hypothetical protein